MMPGLHKANIIATLFLTLIAAVCWAIAIPRMWNTAANQPSAVTLMWNVAIVFTLCACLGWILSNISAIRRERESRCRQCGYILRGLSEPRCPECGESI